MSYLTGNISLESRSKQIPALFKPKETKMDDKEKAAKIARMRKKAEDKTLPQDVRNQMLDNANKLEQEMGEKASGMKYAKGGYAKKKMMMGGMMDKKPMMNKGGYANCGASMKPQQKGKK